MTGMAAPLLLGIVNLTEDSFSDGGRYLDPAAAVAHARRLVADGADVIDLGAAASNIDAVVVDPASEIARLDPVIEALTSDGTPISVDTFSPAVQRYAIARGVAYLNDIHGFADPAIYPELAHARCRLVVMHAVQDRGRAQQLGLDAETVWHRIRSFFAERIACLEAAGIGRDRLILDPGMGFFLSSRPEASLRALAGIARLKTEFGLPVLISVSRKSFLGAVTGRTDVTQRGAATLAAELHAAAAGADFIRTHDAGALRDGLRVVAAIAAEAENLAASR